MTNNSPDAKSADYAAQEQHWETVDALLAGVEAMRAGGEKFLPKFSAEDQANYEDRRRTAVYTALFADVLGGLAAKPFRTPLKLKDPVSTEFKALADDIDAKGRNLHTFAAEAFRAGLAHGVDWVFVDFTKAQLPDTGRPLSQAEEQQQGLRPYFVRIPARDMLAVRSAFVGGQEIVIHARWREDTTVPDGPFAERTVRRVRMLHREPGPGGYGPASFTLFEERVAANGISKEWVVIDTGALTLGIIPLTYFAPAGRKGGSWRFIAPLKGVADLALQHYVAENALLHASNMTAFPMLAGQGVAPATDGGGEPKKLKTGPKTVLYAPPASDTGQHGEWAFIEPDASSLKFLSGEIDKLETRLRQLGRQPLVVGSQTRIEAALHASKTNSAIESWALALKDTLDQALAFAAQWLHAPAAPEVAISTDFDAAVLEADDITTLLELRKSGPGNTPDLSRDTLWSELKRRNILSPTFIPAVEAHKLADEGVGDVATQEDSLAAGVIPFPQAAGGGQ